MNTAERIAKVRELTPFDFMNGANYVLVQQLCDELEKAQTEIQDMKEANEVRQIIATAANKVLCKYEEVEERVKAKRKYWSSMKSDATWFTTDLTVALDGCLAPLDKTDEKGEYIPWPIREIVKALAGATTHLFDTHDCDIHGYELWKCALEAANKYLAPLNPNYAQMVTDDAEAREDA